jgi:hypothetical protein
MMKRLLIVAVSLIAAARCIAADVDALLAESNPAMQKQLEAISRVFHPSDKFSDNVEALREIGKLKEMADEETLVKQVAVFSMVPGEEMQPMTAFATLYYLQPRSRVTMRTLAPYLESENPQLRSFVRKYFQGREFNDYLSYVRQSVACGEDIPAPFIRYIYERSPNEALLVFAKGTANISDQLQAMRTNLEARQQGRDLTELERADIRQTRTEGQEEGQERREVVLAEHIISNALWLKKRGFDERFQAALPEAVEELKKLAQREWWAKLYVIYIMRQNLVLRQDHILRQLADDGNELVSDAAKSAAK